MSNVGTGFRELSPLRVMLCVSAYVMMSMYAFLWFVAGGGMFVTLQERYGWLLRGNVSYSSDWTEQQIVSVESFRKALPYKSNDIYYAFIDIDEEPDRNSWSGAWFMDEKSTFIAAEVDSQIRLMAEGQSVKLPFEVAYGSPAHVAAALGFPDVVRALVEHDSDMVQRKDQQGYTLISRVLSSLETCDHRQVFELSEWLLKQGATMEQAISNADIMLRISRAKADNEIMEWLLTHNISLTPWQSGGLRGLPLDIFVKEGWGLDVFERLVKDGQIDVNDRRANWTYLQFVQMDYPQPEITERLLKLGANPNLLPEPYSVTDEDGEEYGSIDRSALALVLEHYAMEEEGDSEISKSSLATLKLLLSYGATPQPFPDVWLNEENRQEAEAVYRDFGHSINNTTKEKGL